MFPQLHMNMTRCLFNEMRLIHFMTHRIWGNLNSLMSVKLIEIFEVKLKLTPILLGMEEIHRYLDEWYH